jgi:hypothetical protein
MTELTPTTQERLTPAPAPTWVGQATAVEQARAVAEVQAAIVVAQQRPRDTAAAVAAMRETCKQRGLAERAFFRYTRAGSQVTGASVHLARELARCWGNVQYGIAELRRDDDAGISEMQAWAWDLETNTRSSNTFIVPHKRDRKTGPTALTDLRDIYENNANMGARRVREAIFAVLPVWFTEEAKDACHRTIQNGGEKTIAQQAADIIREFEKLGVTTDQLETKLGRDVNRWVAQDLAQLVVIGASLKRGEITVEDEFEPRRTTFDELTNTTPPPVEDPWSTPIQMEEPDEDLGFVDCQRH